MSKRARTALAAVATLVVAPLAVFAGQKMIDKAANPDSAPRLELTDLAVANDGASSPRLDVKVTNTGEKVSFVTRVALRIRRVDDINGPTRIDCYQGAGFFPPSGRYDVSLPKKGGTGETITADVSQEVKADMVDRFEIRAAIGGEGSKSRRAPTIGVSRLFQLQVLLFHDNDATPLSAGMALLAVPFPREVYFDLPKSWGGARACERDNRRLLNRFLKLEGARDNALVAFARAASADTLIDD